MKGFKRLFVFVAVLVFIFSVCGMSVNAISAESLLWVNSKLVGQETCSFVDYRHRVMPHEQYPEISELVINANLDLSSIVIADVTSDDITPEEALHIVGRGHYNLMKNVQGKKTTTNTKLFCIRTQEQLNDIEYVDEWVDKVVDFLKITKKTTVYSAVKRINLFLSVYLDYSDEDLSGNLIKGIQNQEGVCAVYASLFQLLCQKCGIECYFIHDLEHNHGYNMIIMNDGSKYYFDPTANDNDWLRPHYFFNTIQEFKNNHKWETATE